MNNVADRKYSMISNLIMIIIGRLIQQLNMAPVKSLYVTVQPYSVLFMRLKTYYMGHELFGWVAKICVL